MKNLAMLLSAALLLAAAPVSIAGEHAGGHCRTCRSSCCHKPIKCPKCHAYCRGSIEPDTIEKHCWEVECVPICIPKVHFPWEKCCRPKCAKVKYIHVLKKVEYECKTCKCVFEPICHECGECCGIAPCHEGPAGYPGDHGDDYVPDSDDGMPPSPPPATAKRRFWRDLLPDDLVYPASDAR